MTLEQGGARCYEASRMRGAAINRRCEYQRAASGVSHNSSISRCLFRLYLSSPMSVKLKHPLYICTAVYAARVCVYPLPARGVFLVFCFMITTCMCVPPEAVLDSAPVIWGQNAWNYRRVK